MILNKHMHSQTAEGRQSRMLRGGGYGALGLRNAGQDHKDRVCQASSDPLSPHSPPFTVQDNIFPLADRHDSRAEVTLS